MSRTLQRVGKSYKVKDASPTQETYIIQDVSSRWSII